MTPAPSPEQQAVIDAGPGPLRIDAGAGTGKTFTLVRLVERRVEQGTPPERILGITFTNKAAAELAGRVRATVGRMAELGMEVDVHTYHGFAGRLLAEFGPWVGVERHARLITPAFTRQLMHEAITRAGSLTHLDLSAAPQRVDDAIRLASAMADNLVDPSDLVDATGSHKEAERADLAKVVAAFVDEKRRLGVLDYGDLIALAHRLVTERPEVAHRVRSRYDLVILDEYQDTAPAQRLLLQSLFGEGMSVVAVGDTDQTIYEWRGASLENFAEFPHHFPTGGGHPAPTLPLTVNRRSGQVILDAANAVRGGAGGPQRLPLVAADPDVPARLTTAWYRTALDEATAIADLAEEHHEAGTRWSDMAVLVRANKDISIVRQALADAGVPSEVASLGGLLDVPEVVDLHAWLRLLDDPADAVAFARIATGSRLRLGLADLRPLAQWARSDDTVRRSMVEALDHLESLDLRPTARASLLELRGQVRILLTIAHTSTLVDLVREVLAVTDAWFDIESLPEAAALSTRLNVYRFLDLAEAWSPLEGRPSLEAFLGYLDILKDAPTDELDTARISGEDAVTLLSVHRAKGLEWEVVFLPSLTHGKFPSRGAFEDPFGQARVLPHHLRLDRLTLPFLDPDTPAARADVLRERQVRGEWRLAYVAVTRAKRVLHASGASWSGTPEPTLKPRTRSPILEVLQEVPGVEVLANQDPGERPTTLMPPVTSRAPDPLLEDGWDGAIRATLADASHPARLAADAGVSEAYAAAVDEFRQLVFSLPEAPTVDAPPPDPVLSVSGAVTFARCPRRYAWTFVEPLPRRPSAAAARGVAVHRRIELHNLGRVPLDEPDPGEYDASEARDDRPPRTDPHHTFLSSRFATTRPLLVEAPFALRSDGITIRGRIDAIYGDDHRWEVVDFKSGRPSTDAALDLQLDAYAIAVADGAVSPSPPERVAVTFAYLGDGLVERTWEVTADRLAAARERLGGIVRGVTAGDDHPTPSAACIDCDYLTLCPEGKAQLSMG